MAEKSIAEILNSVCAVRKEPAHIRESLVQEIAQTLNDQRSVPFFRIVVLKFSGHEDVIFKCLGLTKETAELSVVKKSRGAIFTHLIKKEAQKLNIHL